MVDKTSIGDRMKGYEAVSQGILMKRMPVVIRVDGKAFHTFTKSLTDKTPYSDVMQSCMGFTAQSLTHYIQNAVFTYVQSDEISILLRDWSTFETQQWFGGKIQKIASISAAMATNNFYGAYEKFKEPIDNIATRPMFDSRVFNLPYQEVTNYFVWRQKDAMRNSVNMLGQYHFSHSELQGKNVSDVTEMLQVKGEAWEDQTPANQRGMCVNKTNPFSSFMGCPEVPPIFTEDRDYVEKWLDGDYNGD